MTSKANPHNEYSSTLAVFHPISTQCYIKWSVQEVFSHCKWKNQPKGESIFQVRDLKNALVSPAAVCAGGLVGMGVWGEVRRREAEGKVDSDSKCMASNDRPGGRVAGMVRVGPETVRHQTHRLTHGQTEVHWVAVVQWSSHHDDIRHGQVQVHPGHYQVTILTPVSLLWYDKTVTIQVLPGWKLNLNFVQIHSVADWFIFMVG